MAVNGNENNGQQSFAVASLLLRRCGIRGMLCSEKETKQLSKFRLENSLSRLRSVPCGRLELLSYELCYVNHNAENKTGTMAETAFGSGLLVC